MVVVTPDNPKLDITKVCKYCKGQYVAPSKMALRKHVQRTHKEAHVKYTKSYPTTLEYYSYECPDCVYSGPSFCALRQHRYRKHGKRRYQCEECSFTSTTITEIRKHKIKAAHFGIGLPLPRWNNLQPKLHSTYFNATPIHYRKCEFWLLQTHIQFWL